MHTFPLGSVCSRPLGVSSTFHSLSKFVCLKRLKHDSSILRGIGETDSYAIPLRPTWSVNDLLSSYPKPSLTANTLKRLHELSALVPPEEGSPEHTKLTSEMEDLIKLVEAVKLVDLKEGDNNVEAVPDGRVWAEGTGIELSGNSLEREVEESGKELSGRDLLQYAPRIGNGMYLVDAERRKK